MNEKLPALDYAKPGEKLPTQLNDFVTGLFVGRLRSKWFYLQLLYYLALAVPFLLISFWVGPDRWPTRWMSPLILPAD